MRAFTIGWGIAWRWAAFYLVLSFVTQLWAGSQFSAGQGGGFRELVGWSIAFGVIAVGVSVEREINGRRVIDPQAAFVAGVVGQVIASVAAIAWFTSKGGPAPGDWWLGPAGAAVCVAVWVQLLAPRRSDVSSAIREVV